MNNETAKQSFHKLRGESGKISREVRRQSFTYIAAGLGLVAGLAWNEAIKTLIETVFPMKQNTIIAKFLYAAIITLAVVLITNYLAKLLTQEKNE